MNPAPVRAQRIFSLADQQEFATVSGDHNPLHLDAIAARRTQAGAPVVHGIHLLLWSLDILSAQQIDLLPMRTMRVRFSKFVYLNELVAVQLTEHNDRLAKLSISLNGTPVAQIVIEFGEEVPQKTVAPDEPLPRLSLPAAALDLDFDAMASLSGRLPFASPPNTVATLFPAASKWLGRQSIAVLAATTNLVGMVCPGLHSIYSSLFIESRVESRPADVLDFRVISTDRRFRMVRIAIAGADLVGTIDSFARVPPTAQTAMSLLMDAVGPTEFSGSTALVVGGSRGIGELTAKLIAAGGGRVIITYRVGKTDAEKVLAEINAAGGVCEVFAFDARQPAQPQLSRLSTAPTHLYYFATPPIFGHQSEIYSRARFDEFMSIYVDGFSSSVQALQAKRSNLSVFYPSSVAVTERPRGMTEYAMAKAAGELLCADVAEALAPLHVLVHRLPRLATDQTATFVPVETAPMLDTMLPLIREVQSWPRSGS